MEGNKAEAPGPTEGKEAPAAACADCPSKPPRCCAKEDDGTQCKDAAEGGMYFCSWHYVNHGK